MTREKTEGHCRRGHTTTIAAAAADNSATINNQLHKEWKRERFCHAVDDNGAAADATINFKKNGRERDATAPGEREGDVPPTTQQSNL